MGNLRFDPFLCIKIRLCDQHRSVEPFWRPAAGTACYASSGRSPAAAPAAASCSSGCSQLQARPAALSRSGGRRRGRRAPRALDAPKPRAPLAATLSSGGWWLRRHARPALGTPQLCAPPASSRAPGVTAAGDGDGVRHEVRAPRLRAHPATSTRSGGFGKERFDPRLLDPEFVRAKPISYWYQKAGSGRRANGPTRT